jgi:hypothetical protein
MVSHGPRHEGSLEPRLLAPPTQRACAPLVLRVVGLPAGAAVHVSAATVDRTGRPWSAEAEFRSPDTVVDVTRDASLGGSYLGVEPDGLLTTMRPVRSRAVGRGRFLPSTPGRFQVRFVVRVGGAIVGTSTVTRVLVDPDVTVRRLAIGEEAVGSVWQPPAGQLRRPPVVVLAPASSPMAAHAPGLLASRGYPAVGIAWPARRLGFIWPSTGRRRGQIDHLERELVSSLAGSGIDLHGAVLLGQAEGAEAALRTAADLADLGAVVAYLPVRRPGSIRQARAAGPRSVRTRRHGPLGRIGARVLVVSDARPAGNAGVIGRDRDGWFTTPGWCPSGPGRLPGDAQGGTVRHLGGEAWDRVLELLRDLSITDDLPLTGTTPSPVSWAPRVPSDRGRSGR